MDWIRRFELEHFFQFCNYKIGFISTYISQIHIDNIKKFF